MKGKFITFEGMEGSGKSTHARLLVSRLIAEGRDAFLTREPGGTKTGEHIRRMLKTGAGGEPPCAESEILLFAASRAQLVRQVILPALKSGTVVVSDRFADSTTVYQGYARGLNMRSVLEINSFVVGPAVPDLTILLDVDVKTGLRRLEARNRRLGVCRDRIEREGVAFHRKVRAGYLKLAKDHPDRVKVVNASLGADAVKELVWRLVCNVIR